MKALSRHLTRTLVAGVVALLPIGGLVLSVVLAERTIADSGLADQPFYFPGLGLVAVVLATYAIGLTITTFVGRILWSLLDGLLDRLPALGSLYRTLKQVLGYGQGEDAVFERAVLVPGREPGSHEIGLVTRHLPARDGCPPRLAVFVPSTPTPTSGRLVLIDTSAVEDLPVSVHEALKFLVGVGSLGLGDEEDAGPR